ncbi:hypothetical protein IJG90_00925 [Candidatus Saccharibacteria bacterium]|nr:hypothetical protein [Candidatus Saccharibacteria bacterium]
MEDNLTLEEEEIVHENPCIDFLPKHPILRCLLGIIAGAALVSLPILGHIP